MRRGAGRRGSRTWWLRFLLAGLVAVLAAGVYLATLWHPFAYDDYTVVVANPSIRDLDDPGTVIRGSLFRPLTNLSFAVDYRLWDLDPRGYHLTGVLLHAINAALLFWLTMGTVRDADGAATDSGRRALLSSFAASALFALHPLMSEGVAYVSARGDVLAGTLLLLAMVAMRAGLATGRGGLIALSLGLAAGAVAAKEIGIVFPFLALVYDRVVRPGSDEARRRRLWRLHLPLIAAAALAGVARAVVFLGQESRSLDGPLLRMGTYLTVELEVLWRYVFLLAAPVSQSVHYVVGPSPRRSAIAAFALIAVCAAAVRWRRRAPVVVFGVAWFLLLLAPSSSVLPLQHTMAEHRAYLASAGLFLAAGAVLGRLDGALAGREAGRMVIPVILAAVLATLAGLTLARVQVWRDGVALWRDAAAKTPTWHTYIWLGDELRRRGDCASAVGAYEEAVRLSPRRLLGHQKLRECLILMGRTDEVRRVEARMLELDPSLTTLCNEIATTLPRERFEDCFDVYRINPPSGSPR